jgi:hypothetical protein
MSKFIRLQICAAWTNGCLSDFRMADVSEKDFYQILQTNGWWLDRGKWVCPEHLRSPRSTK